MVYRRVNRIDTNNQETYPVQKNSGKTFLSWVLKISSILWSIITFLWYWTERIALVVLLLVLTLGLAWWLSQKPSLLRDWEMTDALLPEITWSGESVTVKDIRNHLWMSATGSTPLYYDATYNLEDLERVDYVITPFSESDGPAHTMLTFSFS